MSRSSQRIKKPTDRYLQSEQYNFSSESSDYNDEISLTSTNNSNNEPQRKKQKTQKSYNSEIPLITNFFSLNYTIDDLYNKLILEPEINVYNITKYKTKSIIIEKSGVKIFMELNKMMSYFVCIELAILDSNNKYIELRDIGFHDSIKLFSNYEDLIKEIIRIINLDYNMECYYEEKNLALKLSELKFNVDKTRELYVTLDTSIASINVILNYPHTSIGNRGIKFNDPVKPFVIKSQIENFGIIVKKKKKINQINYFNSLDELVVYLRDISNI